MTNAPHWFDVDRAGLAKLVERRGKTFVLAELLQNAYDAVGTTKVFVTTRLVPNLPLVDLSVTDDAPDGFTHLEHAFTLFAESSKRSDPSLRGRFNLGEKLVLALCEEAEISTVRGSITFNHLGRRVSRHGARAAGSHVCLRLRMTRDEHSELLKTAQGFIPPVETWVNDIKIPHRSPIREISATLVTEWADEDGVLRRGPRKTTVRIYEPRPGVPPTLYELGIPVTEIASAYDLEIMQKVPLTMERDALSPAFLRAVNAAVLNAMADRLDAETATQGWVTEALEHRDTTHDALRIAVTARFGKDAVVYDPSDREANGNAHARGFSVVHGGSFSHAAWSRIREAEALRPAGAVFPTRHPSFGDGPTPTVAMTPAMEAFRAMVEPIAQRLVGAPITITFANQFTQPFGAWYGQRRMTFNIARLGKAWFESPITAQQLALVLHELGHEYEADHTSSRYHDALVQLGSKATVLALEEPALFLKPVPRPAA